MILRPASIVSGAIVGICVVAFGVAAIGCGAWFVLSHRQTVAASPRLAAAEFSALLHARPVQRELHDRGTALTTRRASATPPDRARRPRAS